MKQHIRFVFLSCFYANACFSLAERVSPCSNLLWNGPNLLQLCYFILFYFHFFGLWVGDGNNQWLWLWERTIIFLPRQNKPKPDLSLLSSASLYWSCFCSLSGSPDSGAKMICEWDQHIENDCSFVFIAVLFMLVSSLCCSISAVKQTLKARCRNAAMSWDELVLCLNSVYAYDQHQGMLERTLRTHWYQWWFRIALLCLGF